METAVICEMPKGVVPPPSGIGTLGACFHPTPTCEKKLGRSDERLIGELVTVLDRQLIAAVEARSIKEFSETRTNVMPRYVRALRALNDTAINLASSETLECILEAVCSELADDLEKQRERFGEKLTEQAVFTLWTIQKIRALRYEISSTPAVPDEKRGIENKLRHEYHAYSMWAQFHLDVLFAAIKYDRPICDEIKETICDGLRSAVNAFVIMKDVLALRQPQEAGSEPAPVLPWDDEDEQLLASSMRDMNGEPASD